MGRGWAWTRGALILALVALALLWPRAGRAIGEATDFALVGVAYGSGDEPRPSARRRLAWAVRTRTSIAANLAPGVKRLDDPAIFDSPFLYLAGERAFAPLSDAEISGLRRFIEFGGFLLIDDASGGEGEGFDASVRRSLARAFPDEPLAALPRDHTLYRSFYLLDRPEGRVRGPEALEGITRDDRLAVLYSRHDLGGAWARDNLGSYPFAVVPGGEEQRERAYRLGVNIVMYALCLDYKDDQVHAPFIMRRRSGRAP